MTEQVVEQLITKTELAALAGVSKARVSQWLDEGIVQSDALVGTGRTAKVRRDLALRQIAKNRSVSQSMGNGAYTRVHLPTQPTVNADQSAPPLAPLEPVEDPIAKRTKLEKLEQAQIQTVRMRREEQVASGRYMLTEDHKMQLGRVASQIWQALDSATKAMAQTLVENSDLDERTARILAEKMLRTGRETVARQFADQREAMSATVTDKQMELVDAG
ncbi:MAG: hypothetical protein AAGG69_02090 [Pseudomonadota bacterium]